MYADQRILVDDGQRTYQVVHHTHPSFRAKSVIHLGLKADHLLRHGYDGSHIRRFAAQPKNGPALRERAIGRFVKAQHSAMAAYLHLR